MMQKIKSNVKLFIVILLLGLWIFLEFLMYKSNDNKINEIYNNDLNKNSMFAIMLEQDNGTFEKSSKFILHFI